MADAPPPGIIRADAVNEVGSWLSTLGATSLDASVLARWAAKRATHGWRLAFVVADQVVTIDFLIDARFPASRPFVIWVDPPPFPNIPHVEADGQLCVLPSVVSFDCLQPVGVAKTILAAVEDIFEKGLTGANFNDFRTEFRSYWNKIAKGREITSVIDPCEPSRRISVWTGRNMIVAAENASALRRWLGNAYGKTAVANVMIQSVPMIWLAEPLLPSEYPHTAAEVHAIVAKAGADALALFETAIANEFDSTLILFGADTGNGGVCFAGVTLFRPPPGKRPRRARVSGFRDRVPEKLLLADRMRDHIVLSPVERADPWWVHGRDSLPDLETLLGATVGIIGCGSLGAPIARFLAQAGVGRLKLIDPELMTYANVGRHTLGAPAVARRKANALKERLAREFPHLRIETNPQRWQELAYKNDQELKDCDLLISTIGSWEHEGELNAFSLAHPAHIPSILFAWGEPHAVGGHALLIGNGSGCLACGLSPYGEARFRVAKFDGETLRREAACGAFFQPYGASEIAAIATMVAKLAIDALYERADAGTHRIVAATATDIAASGGQLTQEWITLSGGRDSGGNQEERRWVARIDCPICGGHGA